MTNQTQNTCGEQDALVSYLYDELDAAERARFENHLAACEACTAALNEMRGVRAQLARWTLPENAGLNAGGSIISVRRQVRPWWAPAALAAAAVILLAVGAGMANLEITYGTNGISVRTGWARNAPAAPPAITSSAPSQPAGAQAGGGPAGVSTSDLAALERRLRTEFQALASSARNTRAASATSASTASQGNNQLLRRVQDLIEQSETRQRRELALRVAQVVRDFDTQRQTDLVRIQQGLGQIEGTTAADRQLLNYLVRASQRQDR